MLRQPSRPKRGAVGVRGIAREGGFSGVEILPVDAGFWRFYRLS
jgi:hypothetical protein